MTESLFLPTEIPWHDIKNKELEELLYWLLDSMGAKDLEWRIGGTGAGTSDQGRDLAFSFYAPSIDGAMNKEHWWAEAKGRNGTVEPLAVKEAVNNVRAHSEVDVLVIATNSAFSNPTRDWVKKWQEDNPRPKIKLWEKTELENFCSKNPVAVIRLFSKSLSPQGKAEVIKSKMWNYATFTDSLLLVELWENRRILKIDGLSLLAFVASEIANGAIDNRSWGAFASKELIVESLSEGLLNITSWVERASDQGTPQEPLLRGLAYLILIGNQRLGYDAINNLLNSVWDQDSKHRYTFERRQEILGAILRTLNKEIRDVCTSDCSRVLTDPVLLTEAEINTYWDRLNEASKPEISEKYILTIIDYKKPCKVGFRLGAKKSCPLEDNSKPERDIAGTLKVIKKVSQFRAKGKK